MSVGTTRITGKAGSVVDLTAYLAADLSEKSSGQLSKAAKKWQYGTGAGAVNVVYADTITLADAANTTLDLYASGSLLDVFGQALTMTALKFLYLNNNSSDASLLVGGGVSNDLDIFSDTSDQLIIPPGGDAILWNDPSAAGLTVTTNKNLRLEHDGTGSNSMDVDVIAMGLD